MTKLTPEEYKKLFEELRVIKAERLRKFQRHLIDNDHIMTDESAEELLEIVEDFLDNENDQGFGNREASR